jgi:hypothetical protein
MSTRIKIASALCLAALAAPAFGGVNSVASLADPLGNGGASARALGMGSAFVGLADDSSALFWNPAGLGTLQNAEVALHHNSWLAGIIQETLVGALPLGRLGGAALSANYVNYGSLAGYDESGNRTDNYSPTRFGMGAGWGIEVLPRVFAGAALKASTQTIADSSYTNVSADLGALWIPEPNIRLGLSYANVGTPVAGYALAQALRLGGSYGVDFSPSNRLLLALSSSIEPSGVNKVQLGLEDMISSMLALRLGYQAGLADSRIDGLSGLTAGLGIRYEGFGLDYAWLPYGDLGSTHRISLGYQFGRHRS